MAIAVLSHVNSKRNDIPRLKNTLKGRNITWQMSFSVQKRKKYKRDEYLNAGHLDKITGTSGFRPEWLCPVIAYFASAQVDSDISLKRLLSALLAANNTWF